MAGVGISQSHHPFVTLRHAGSGKAPGMDGLFAGLTGLPGDHSRSIRQGHHHRILLIEKSLLVDPKDLRTGRSRLQIQHP